MAVDEIYKDIIQKRPSVVYVSGKTSTGKSTFARKLQDDLGYYVIELEAVLLEIVKGYGFEEQSTFRKVLYDSGEFAEKVLFIEATDKVMADVINQGLPIVIESAVANVETLQRILKPASNLFFLYFHPNIADVYVRNLTNRFMQSGKESYGGLPLKFWRFIDDKEFKQFCTTRELSNDLKSSIRQYALTSQEESLTRLNEFRQKFSNIVVVEIQ